MDDDIKRLTQETCLALIPQFYDGVLEATRIQQVNDAIIEPFIAGIMRIHRNAYIQTMDADALSELENGLGITPLGTIEQRRQAVIDALCDLYIVNDATLLELVQSLDGGDTNDIEVDPVQLQLYIKKITNTESDDEFSDLSNARHVVQPVIPQNLNVELKVEAAMQKDLHATYCGISWLRTNIGHVERHIVGDHGFMSDSGDIAYQAEHGVVDRPTGLYTNTLVERGPGEHGTIPMAQEIRGYLRAASYQTANKSVTANSSNYLYGQGESGFLAAESGKTYTLTGAYTNADASVYITGCSISVTSGNVKLEWGSTAANVCYVTISVV